LGVGSREVGVGRWRRSWKVSREVEAEWGGDRKGVERGDRQSVDEE